MSIKDSVFYLGSRVLPAILGLSIVAVLTRFLSPEEYGRYALIMGVVGLANAMLFSWYSQSLYRHYAALRTAVASLFSTSVFGFSLSFLVAAACAGVTAYILQGLEMSPGLIAAAVAMVGVTAWLELAGLIANLEGRSVAYAGLLVSRSAVTLFIGGAAAHVYQSAIGVILSTVVAQIIVALFRPFRRWCSHVHLAHVNAALLARLFSYGWPLSVSISSMLAVATADRLLLGKMAGAAAAGSYSVGFDLAQFAIGAIGGAISLAFYPRILTELEDRGDTSARLAMTRYSVLLLAVTLPAAVGLAMISENVVGVLVGPGLRYDAARVMPWICAAAFLGTMKSFLADLSFQLGKWTQGGAIVGVASVAINVVLNLELIPRNGVVGAAQASVLSFALALLMSMVLGRVRGFRISGAPRQYAKVAAASLVMVAALYPLRAELGPGWLVLQVAFGAVAYGVSCYLMDVLGSRSGGWKRWSVV